LVSSKDNAMPLDRHLEIAFSSPQEIAQLQRERLCAHLDHCKGSSPYYGDVLPELDTGSHGSIAEILSSLPFTDKENIEQHNDEMCAVTPDKIVDIAMSSGTTGEPTKVVYSEHDLQRLAYNEQKSLLGCGLSINDTVLLTCTIDRCFVAGLAYFLGIRAIGAAAVRNGHGTMASHAQIVERLQPTAIVGVPTFVRRLGSYMKESGLDPAETAVSRIVCIGEPIRNRDLSLVKVGSDIQEAWDARVFSTYASSETVTTFCECSAQEGGHLHPDLGIVEIVDDAGHTLAPGEVGEVVVTPLDVEAMPLVRFRTGDVSFLMDEPCSCGRNSVRLGPILGREKQMLKVKGTTVYPQAVFAVLSELDFVSDYYVSVSSQDDLSDHLTVHVSVTQDGAAQTIQEKLQARLRIKPEVSVEEERDLREKIYLPEFRKPMRFRDLRAI
jgi:phenylacetate-CoA ligase